MIAEPPYAYKDHSLADHILGCVKLIERFLEMNRNYPYMVHSRFVGAGLDVPGLRTIEDMLKIGTLIHDMGKAYRYYQEKLERYRGGFEHHEILSAVSCYKILRDNNLLENQKLKVLLLMSILNHHQALRESLMEILFGANSSIGKVVEIARRGLCKSISNLERVLTLFNLRLEEVFPRDSTEFNSILHELRSTLNLFLRVRFDENRRWIKLYSLIMLPIVLADNLDASEKRNGSQSRLVIKELMKVMGYG